MTRGGLGNRGAYPIWKGQHPEGRIMRFAVLLAALALSSPALGFTAQNGLIVRPDGAADFTIPWRGRSGPQDFWCAAGDYAVRALHLNPTTMIYRGSEPPRRAGEPMTFTLSADRAASSSGLATLFDRRAGLTAGHAQSLCEIRRNRR